MAKAKKKGKKHPLILTPLGRFNFVYLDKVDSGREFSDDKYKVDILFDKKTWPEDGKELRTTALKVIRKFVEDDKAKLSDFAHPFKDGDEKDMTKESNKAYAGHYYITPKSEYQPKVFKPDGKTEMTPEEVSRIKSGDYGRAVVAVYAYSQGPGVTLGLNLVQFHKEGPALGGSGTSASMALLNELHVELEDPEDDDDEMDEDDL